MASAQNGRTVVSARDHSDAARIASAAGRLLLQIRAELATSGEDVTVIRSEGDRRSHAFITGALADAHPDDAILSEEGTPERRRLGARRVWIVDPLDGTREFGDAGRADWAVHVALVVDGIPAAGAVALPARGLTLATRPQPQRPAPVARRPRLLVSRTRGPEIAARVADYIGAVLVPMGSAGAKTMAVVLGEADIYLHAGGQYEWDSAAPAAVAAAAGLHVSRLDGAPLRYNRPDPWLPDLLVCRPELARLITAAVGTVGGRSFSAA